MMTINIYKTQTEIAKTYSCEAYDLMYGTVEDILEILDGVNGASGEMELAKAVSENREKINNLILDIFPEMTRDELRGIKVKELLPFFVELFNYVGKSFKNSKN